MEFPNKGQLCQTAVIVVMIWGLWHSPGLHGGRWWPEVGVLMACWAVGAVGARDVAAVVSV